MTVSYFIVILGILIAKALGFFRDVTFAGSFGTSAEADVYAGVFGVVTLVFTGVGIALSTLVIKNLNKPENDAPERRRAFVSSFIVRTALCLIMVTAALYAAAPFVVRLLLPGLSDELFPLALRVTYIMLPSLFFVVIAYIISGVLQNSRVFFIPSVVSLPYNVLIISLLLFAEPDIVAVSAATTAGWALHVVFQLPSFYRCGYRFFCREKCGRARFPGGRETLAVFVSNMAHQLSFIIDRGLVSGGEGAVSALNYASGLFVTVSSVFVVAMSSVIFPALSKRYEAGDLRGVRRLLGNMTLSMAVIFVPYLLTVSVFGRNIVSLIWERGSFTAEASSATATAFVIYSFAIFGYIAEELYSKVLYLASGYAATVGGVLAVVAAKLLTGSFFTERFGPAGAAASTTVILTGYAAYITLMVKRRVGHFISKEVFFGLLRVLLAGGAALLTFFSVRAAAPGLFSGRASFLLPLALCGGVYAAAIFALGVVKTLFYDMKSIREM